MKKIETDVVIVGSGAGGATVAKDLAGSGKRILILEKGINRGRYRQNSRLRNYFLKTDFLYSELTDKKILGRKVNTVYWIGIGGTTIVSSAIFVRSLETKLQSYGINIEREFREIEQDLNVTPYPESQLGLGGLKLFKAADSLDIKWEFMPRAIDFEKCRFCGECTLKCYFDSKWTAVDFINEARDKGVSLIESASVSEVLYSNDKVTGVKGRMGSQEFSVFADTVVLAAGAIETSVILKNSGIDRAGNKLFCDPYYVMYDSCNNAKYWKEPIAIINKEFVQNQGFMLANSNVTRHEKVFRRLPKSLKPNAIPAMLGIMVKIRDDSEGRIYRDGRIHKVLTSADTEKIKSSLLIAKNILSEAGVEHKHIKIRFFPGVHPGGTAGIGEVVDENLQSEIENCYVSDASVLPEAPGLPPLLTILALSRRLAKRLSNS